MGQSSRESKAAYRARNREKLRAKGREYARRRYREQRERLVAEAAARRAADPEAHRRAARSYYQRNAELMRSKTRRYKAAHPQETRAYLERWRAENAERVRELAMEGSARRRARLAGAPGEWAAQDFAALCKQWAHLCAYCGCEPERLGPDHAVPLSRGGVNFLSNIVPCCLRCNFRKGTKTAEEFLAWLALRGEARHMGWGR